MKKTLSLLSACALALCASAQQEAVWSTQESLEALGLSSDATAVAEGTVLAEGEAGSFFVAYEDQGKIMDISADNIKSVKIDGQEYALTKGTSGSTNPGGVSITTPPTGGWVYQINAQKDGWVVLFSKFSSNKSYYVWESDLPNQMAETASLLSYNFAMLFQGNVWSYTLPGDADGYFTMDLPDADKYSDGTSLRWPEKIFLGADAADVKKNGFGCIMFPVLEGFGYLFHAQGSKANTNGFIFTETEPALIEGLVPEKTDPDTGEVTQQAKTYVLYEKGATGVANVAVDAKSNQMYNVMGQPVNAGYKGLVIKNGKKFFNR